MSCEKGVFGDDAENIFWETPELVDKLLSYLDLTSIKHLAEFHKVIRHSLEQAAQEDFPRGSDHPQLDSVRIRN